MQRPRTSTPRGVCMYYALPRGCFAGNSCKFLHGDPDTEQLTPYDKAKVCRFYQNGYCKRGETCWFRHVKADQTTSADARPSSAVEDSPHDDICSICFDTPTTYGLLGGCSHVFCISCIRKWRLSTDKSPDVIESGANKKCPMCREPSRFITPTSHFYPHNTPEKDEVVAAYKASMQKVKCRYFEQSRNSRGGPDCPFGQDCFYLHLHSDGTPHVFTTGATAGFRRQRARMRPDMTGADMATHWDILSRSLGGFFSSFADSPNGNISMTIDAIRTGLHGLNATLEEMAPTIAGSRPIDDTPRTPNTMNARQNGDQAGPRRSVSATARHVAGIGQMADDLLAMIASLPLQSSGALDRDDISLGEGSQASDDDALWNTDDMPSLEPISEDLENSANRAIFAEWMPHDPSTSSIRPTAPNSSQASRSIAVSDTNSVRERIHVGGSGSHPSHAARANGSINSNAHISSPWVRRVLSEREGRWTETPPLVFGTANRRDASRDNESDDDGDLPELLSVSESGSQDGSDDSDLDADLARPSEQPVVPPVTPSTPATDDSPSATPLSTHISAAKDSSNPLPEFTTDGRGRVIAAGAVTGATGESSSATDGQDRCKQLQSPNSKGL